MESELAVGDIMRKEVIVLPADGTVKEAAKLMANNSVGSVVIIDGDEAVGILTERDIIRKVVARDLPLSVKVREVMSSPLVVVKPDFPVERVAEVMRDKGVRRLPVINEEGYLVGIITDRDLVRVLPSLLDLIEEEALVTH